MTRVSFILCISLVTFFISHCSCAIENDKVLKCYEEYFNRENTNFTYEDGILYNMEKLHTNAYKIEITIKVKEQANPKSFRLLKCTATLHDDAGTLTVDENQCDDGTSSSRSSNDAADVNSELDYSQDETTELSTTESDLSRQALNLDSEVQSDNAQINSSGEQFVAIPRPQPSSPCIGCSSLVDNNAPGVEELAKLAIRHLNKHTPDITYKLKSILQVERQVQVVNGVRYILTIDVSDLKCVETLEEDCSAVKTCKVSILEKPWLKIPNGKKFRAVLSNNCTEQWLFGEDGEELLTKDDNVTNSEDEVIKVNRNIDLQATPNSERKLTGQELKELEDQIIPTNEIERQKRYVKAKSEEEVVLEPKSVNLLDLAIKAFESYSSKKKLRLRVVYATRMLSVDGVITRIDFNVRVLEPTVKDATNEVNMRCHTRVSENIMNEKSFYTYCKQIDNEISGVIEMPASDPNFRAVASEKLRTDYGKLLQFYEVVRVYVIAGANVRQNIIFDAKLSADNVYRCYLISPENFNTPPLVCKKEVIPRIEKDPTALKYLHLATVALKKYLIHTNIPEPYIVAVVTHASELAGLLTDTDIDIDFIAVDFHSTLRCVSQIQEYESSDILKISVNCSTIPERKEYPTGVIIQRNPLDFKYTKIAKKALKKNYSHLDFKDLRVVYVNEQLLDTLITRIDFEITNNSSAGFRCHVKLSQKPSEKKEYLYVNCFPKSKEIIGGSVDHNASDPKYWKIAEEALIKKYNNSMVLLDVVRVTTQILSGISYKIDFYAISPLDNIVNRCHSIKIEKMQNQMFLSDLNVECLQKDRPGSHGEIEERNPSYPKYKALALEALAKEYPSYPTEPLQIVYANEQLVSGLITRLDLNVGGENNALVFRCHIYLFEKPSEGLKTLYIDCFPKALNLPGGRFEHNASDPKNWKLAEESLVKEYNSSLLLLDVIRVTTAVEDGFMTETDFYAILDSDKVRQKCYSLKFDQPLKNLTNIIVKCEPIKNKTVSGSIIEKDPKDPKLRALAVMALMKKYPDLNYYNLSVVYANEQVTNDLITRVDFDVLDMSKISEYRCHIKSFGWLIENELNMTINCFKKGSDDGRRELNASDPRNWQDAQESLAKQYGSSLFLVEVLRVTTRSAYDGINETDFYAMSQSNNVEYRCHNTMLINVLENFKDTELSCEPLLHSPIISKTKVKPNDRSKRKPGSKNYRDPKKTIYFNLAKKSLRQYLDIENVETQYNITVEEVTTQLVEGISTDIYFSAVSIDNSGGHKCHSNIWERGWLRSLTINVKCSPLPTVGRKKRQNLLGGKTPQDRNNPKYLSLARKSLVQYFQERDPSKQFEITIENVTTQVVAGELVNIDYVAKALDNSGTYKCHSEIWERVWLNSTKIDVNCSLLQLLGRNKREDFVGGNTPQDPNNPKYLSLARKSLVQYFQERDITNNPSKQFEITIENVTTQVVAGELVNIDYVAKSLNNSGTYKCHSEIWERVWLKSTIIKVNCTSLYQKIGTRTSRNIPTPIQKDPSDHKYMAYAEKSLSQYLNLDGLSHQYQITVEQVTKTIVSGLLTNIHFTAVDKRGFKALVCDSTIWEQAWLNSTKIEVKCNPLQREERSIYDIVSGNDDHTEDLKNSRIKRSISDKNKISDENSPKIDNEDIMKADHFANQALKYIHAKYRHPRQMKVISIFSFTKDYSAAHYRIKMEVGYTNCLALSPTVENCSLVSDIGANKFCRVSVWLQPKGDHPPRFEVSCDIEENQIEENKKIQAENLFFDFLVAHKPAYLNNFEEMRRRLEIFKRNIDKIHELNTHERGTARYAVTKFSDLNDVEFRTKYLGLKPHLASSNFMTKAKIPNVTLPISFDWREKGAVTEVKNQGQCGSCWAFSVTGNIEGQWKLKSGQLVSLSEQELVDCDTVDKGCSGGLPDNAYRAIEQLGGLETEQDYPYEARNDKCNYNKTMSKVQINGAVNITANETSMAMWMVEHGPISIGLNANGMQFYMGGVSHPWKVLCNPKNLDHGVLIVGYGIKEYPLYKKSLPYWIIKNSWGHSWGEQGYYRLYRGDGACGVDQMASSAVIN